MKHLSLFVAAIALTGAAAAQQCGLIACPFPPTFVIGGPAKQFSVQCTPPSTAFTDLEVFQAIGASTSLQASRIGNSNLSTMVANNVNGHCFNNTRTHWEGCTDVIATSAGSDYLVQVTGTMYCSTAGAMPYYLQGQ